jgi:hypothetical protein
MALSPSDQRAIVRADSERRQAREIEEYLALHRPSQARQYDPHADGNPELTSGVGVVSPPRSYVGHVRVTRHGQRTRVVGIAPNAEGVALAHAGVASVLVTHADGTSETRPVSSFRAASRARRAHAERATVTGTSHRLDRSDAARLAHIIGNSPELAEDM